MKKVFCILVLILLAGPIGAAYSDTLVGFDDKATYDIYFANGSNKTLFVRDVTIAGVKQIGDKLFLRVENNQFKISDSKGLIALDSISAIMPSNVFQVKAE